MQTPDLIKLAPTLSAEERYKLIVPDFQREVAGEKSLISESERQAILRFDDRKAWEEYTRRVLLYRWANALWVREIETEKLRTYACYLFLNHHWERVVVDADETLSKEKRTERFERLKKYVSMLSAQSRDFYAYREATAEISQELYGVPLFDPKTMKEISNHYEVVDDFIESYNVSVEHFCKLVEIKKFLKPILQDKESYLVKKPVPDEKEVGGLVDGIKRVAEAEMRALR